MSEELKDENNGSGAEAPELSQRGEAVDERIAPSAPRGENDASGAAIPASGASEATEPASRRPRKAIRAVGIAAALVLCAVAAAVGVGAGWFSVPAPSDPLPMPRVVSDAPSDGPSEDGWAPKGDEGIAEDGAEAPAESEGEAEGSAAVEEHDAVDADGSDAPTSGEAPSAGEASSSGGASAPAAQAVPAPAPDPAPEPQPAPEPAPAPSTVTVSVYVDSSRAASEGYPSSLGGGTVTLNQGASVYDALCATGMSVGGSSGYVSSIGGLAEFQCGPGSGWLYFVNGSSPGYGCGSYILNGGESITWIYTLDMGNDL